MNNTLLAIASGIREEFLKTAPGAHCRLEEHKWHCVLYASRKATTPDRVRVAILQTGIGVEWVGRGRSYSDDYEWADPKVIDRVIHVMVVGVYRRRRLKVEHE